MFQATLLVLTAVSVSLTVSEDVSVTTPAGTVKGNRVFTGDGHFRETFLGIPYATPPVGPLRFRPPLPIQPWPGTLDATQFSPMCPQQAFPGTKNSLPTSEDCLYLNIYSSGNLRNAGPLQPVMVYIHGGAFMVGSAAPYNGSELTTKDVVVVTINYRLGALGFLSTEDAACPGNFGLLDQILALKWVKDNIASFHGNPHAVTIFGESSGSISVSLLTLSPLAKGLFHRAIMESGSSIGPLAALVPGKQPTSPLQYAQLLADAVGCNDAMSTTDLLDCLRNLSVEEIINGTLTILKNPDVVSPFLPTVDTETGVLPGDPANLLHQNGGSDVNTLSGINKNEAALFYLYTPLDYFTPANVERDILKLSKNDPLFPSGLAQNVTDLIIAEYITARNISTPEEYRNVLIEIETDVVFRVPATEELVHGAMRGVTTNHYIYQFTYRATHDTHPVWASAMHMAELPFVFGSMFLGEVTEPVFPAYNWTSHDALVAQRVMTLWTNFAKYGDPTPMPVGGVMWPPFRVDTRPYLDIGSSLTPKLGLAARAAEIFNFVVEDLA